MPHKIRFTGQHLLHHGRLSTSIRCCLFPLNFQTKSTAQQTLEAIISSHPCNLFRILITLVSHWYRYRYRTFPISWHTEPRAGRRHGGQWFYVRSSVVLIRIGRNNSPREVMPHVQYSSGPVRYRLREDGVIWPVLFQGSTVDGGLDESKNH